MAVLTPERAYQKLGRAEVPADDSFKSLCDRGLYCVEHVDKLNRKGGGRKAAVLVVTGDMILLCTLKGMVMRSLMLRDVEKVVYSREHAMGDVKAAIVPYRHVKDPAIMVLLKGADPFHPLKVASYTRQPHNPSPIVEEKITAQAMSRVASTVSFKRPDDYMKPKWIERKLSVETGSPVRSSLGSPHAQAKNLQTFVIELETSMTQLGLSYSIANGIATVTGVDEGGASQRCGLKAGHIITRVGGIDILTNDDIVQAVEAAKASAYSPPVRIPVRAYHPADESGLPLPPAPLSAVSSFSAPDTPMPSPTAKDRHYNEREKELAEKERVLAEREERLAVAQDAEEQIEEQPAAKPNNITTFTFPPPGDVTPYEDSSEQLINAEDINEVIDRHMMQRVGPAILPPAQRISFYVKDDLIEFIPEDEGVCEYMNGEKVGVATSLVWNPKRRVLHDQNGNGGVVPAEPRLLEKIESFCESYRLPLEVRGDDLAMQFRTPSGDVLRYSVGMGRLGVAVNGVNVGPALEVIYDEYDRTVTAAVSAQLPEGKDIDILMKIANICEDSDVPHNIEAEALLIRETQRKELAELKKSNQELKKQYLIEVEKEHVAAEEKNRMKQETERLENEHRAKLKNLEEREQNIKKAERELAERERRAEEAATSAASIYKRLHHILNDAPVVAEDDVVAVVGGVKNSFHWYDVCEFFSEEGDDLPTALRGLSDPTVKKIEALLESKGARLRKAKKPNQTPKTVDMTRLTRPTPTPHHPSSFNPTMEPDDATLPDVSTTHVPTFRRTLTTPPIPVAMVRPPPPPSAFMDHPIFNSSSNMPTMPAPNNTNHSFAAYTPLPLPQAANNNVEYIPEATSPTFTSPRPVEQLDVMKPLKRGHANAWTDDTIRQLEEAHDRLRQSVSPKRAVVSSEVARKLDILSGSGGSRRQRDGSWDML